MGTGWWTEKEKKKYETSPLAIVSGFAAKHMQR